ncbi:MAG: hypothetical protein ABSF46_30890 [Terriglobia bacterium]
MSKLGYLFTQLFRNAQRLFHLLVGLTFLVLAAAGATVSFAEWQNYLKTPAQGLIGFVLYASFTVFLVILCLYSFVKARNIR